MSGWRTVFRFPSPREAWRHSVIEPGQSVDGTALWVFRLTKQQWDARKDWLPDPNHSDPESKSGLNFTFSIQYQRDLVLAPQTAVMEQ
jgi:hypothetical protein